MASRDGGSGLEGAGPGGERGGRVHVVQAPCSGSPAVRGGGRSASPCAPTKGGCGGSGSGGRVVVVPQHKHEPARLLLRRASPSAAHCRCRCCYGCGRGHSAAAHGSQEGGEGAGSHGRTARRRRISLPAAAAAAAAPPTLRRQLQNDGRCALAILLPCATTSSPSPTAARVACQLDSLQGRRAAERRCVEGRWEAVASEGEPAEAWEGCADEGRREEGRDGESAEGVVAVGRGR